MENLKNDPASTELLQHANVLVALLETLPFKVNYWKAQNIYYSLLESEYPSAARRQDTASRRWVEQFASLGGKLQVSVPPAGTRAELRMAS